jgi:predicted DNA-binding protein (UPF0251 family)
MARPQKNRKIINPPKMQGFKPFGIAICESENVVMQYDEYESIKLVNYQNLSQDEAADLMEVSRPTLTRMYNCALKKIAKAFVEGKCIIIEGGNFEFEKDWYKCKKCFRLFEGLENHSKCDGCKLYGTDELIKLNKNINQ